MVTMLKKPVQRSRVRLWAGQQYYTWKKYAMWYLLGRQYTVTKAEPLEHAMFCHRSVLLRRLQGVDMQLQVNKVTNLRLALARLDGVIIRPGEYLSFWKLVGKPTRRKGYLDGLILNYDGTFFAGTGGGLCQLTNLLYWMFLHSPLKVTERYRHSHDVFPDVSRTQPFGSGATCFYNYLDLEVYNGTSQTLQLKLWLDEEYLQGELRSTELSTVSYQVYEREHIIEPHPYYGYLRKNTIYRRTVQGDDLLADEYITGNVAIMMYAPLLTAPREERIVSGTQE